MSSNVLPLAGRGEPRWRLLSGTRARRGLPGSPPAAPASTTPLCPVRLPLLGRVTQQRPPIHPGTSMMHARCCMAARCPTCRCGGWAPPVVVSANCSYGYSSAGPSVQDAFQREATTQARRRVRCTALKLPFDRAGESEKAPLECTQTLSQRVSRNRGARLAGDKYPHSSVDALARSRLGSAAAQPALSAFRHRRCACRPGRG